MSPSVTRSEKPVKPDEAAPPGTDSELSAARGVMRKMGSASPKIARNRQAAAAGRRGQARGQQHLEEGDEVEEEPVAVRLDLEQFDRRKKQGEVHEGTDARVDLRRG